LTRLKLIDIGWPAYPGMARPTYKRHVGTIKLPHLCMYGQPTYFSCNEGADIWGWRVTNGHMPVSKSMLQSYPYNSRRRPSLSYKHASMVHSGSSPSCCRLYFYVPTVAMHGCCDQVWSGHVLLRTIRGDQTKRWSFWWALAKTLHRSWGLFPCTLYLTVVTWAPYVRWPRASREKGCMVCSFIPVTHRGTLRDESLKNFFYLSAHSSRSTTIAPIYNSIYSQTCRSRGVI
jgi:hypothetical protein